MAFLPVVAHWFVFPTPLLIDFWNLSGVVKGTMHALRVHVVEIQACLNMVFSGTSTGLGGGT